MIRRPRELSLEIKAPVLILFAVALYCGVFLLFFVQWAPQRRSENEAVQRHRIQTCSKEWSLLCREADSGEGGPLGAEL